MDIKKLLGEKFVEGMTAEEMLEALKDVDEPTAPPQGNVVDKAVFDKTAKELATLKKDYKTLSEQNLTDEQRRQQELDKALEMQMKYEKALLKLEGTKRLMDGGIADQDFISDLFDKATFNTSDEMNSVIDKVIALSTQLVSSTEQRVRAEILKNTPVPKNTSEDKKDVESLSLTERMKMKSDDPVSYKNLFGGN